MARYLLDANIFLQAKNLHYGLDFCPAFWEWLVLKNEASEVASIKKVLEELQNGDTKFTEWVKKRGTQFFLPEDGKVIGEMRNVSSWVTSWADEGDKNKRMNSRRDFLAGADLYLIAHAKAHDWIVVTHEAETTDESNEIKIPYACKGLGVECCDPYKMLHERGANFVLGSDRG